MQTIPGVRYCFTAKDIPGNNDFTPIFPTLLVTVSELLFVDESHEVQFFGQPAGIILADTMELATVAAAKVQITYYSDYGMSD